jgi:gliding motility-associated-like protein
MNRKKEYLQVFFLCCFLYITVFAKAQCDTVINTFPYNEGFENSMGSWFVSNNSVNSDWAWGKPGKTIINNAGSGNNCWITGGLTNNAYNNGEESFLQSPCFNISSLQNPIISFKIFWETENNYDGAGFQYSTDEGKTWTNLGSANDVSNCADNNWFNNAAIRYLSTTEGWSGSISDGNGSGKWVTAQHDLSAMKGLSDVAFRFSFGAGTKNNNYDGVAVDDIFIGEAQTGNPDFNYVCKPNNEIDFTAINAGCAKNFSWNFGDVNSGANNTSNVENPSHIFSSAGNYSVIFIANGTTIIKQINIFDLAVSTKSVTCFDAANGSATASIIGGNNNYIYSWNTDPAQTTATIKDLSAGTYTVTVSALNSCSISQSISILQPEAIATDFKITNEICGNKKGAVFATTTGGIMPYKYVWNNNEQTSFINNLSANNYSVLITDANKCEAQYNNIIVEDSITTLQLFLGNDTSFCPGNSLVLNAGNFKNYLWQNNSDNSTYTAFETGKYFVEVSDSNGCSTSDTINITVNCSNIFFPSAFTPNNDGRNDLYGALGNLASVKEYSFYIYNRWGQLVFHTNNPYEKWDGKLKGQYCDAGTFIWFATYSIDTNPKQMQKGTVIFLR